MALGHPAMLRWNAHRWFACSGGACSAILAQVAQEQDDLMLLAAWRGGDRELGSVLFRRHVAGVSRFFRTKVPDQAEDLTQKTFLALVESESRFAANSSFRTYLFGIARNQLLMHLRSKSRANARFEPLTRSAVAAGASPARIAAQQQQQQLILTALQNIPVDYQVALELHYFESMALAEIALVLAEPVGTVKSRLSRGRVILRETLESLAEPSELLRSAVSEMDRWASSLSGLTIGRTQ